MGFFVWILILISIDTDTCHDRVIRRFGVPFFSLPIQVNSILGDCIQLLNPIYVHRKGKEEKNDQQKIHRQKSNKKSEEKFNG